MHTMSKFLFVLLDQVTALVSTVAGGVLAAAGWLLIRASSSSERDISGDHSHGKYENTWNPFLRDSNSHSHTHTAGDRHPSWSNRPNSPNDDASPGSNGSNQMGASQMPSAHAPPVQGKGQEVEAKNGKEDLRGGDDEQRGSGAKTDEEIEREWPVFGSDGVGGRFGAF